MWRTGWASLNATEAADGAVQASRILDVLGWQADRHDVATQGYASALQQHHGDVVVHTVALAEVLVYVVVLDVRLGFRALVDLCKEDWAFYFCKIECLLMSDSRTSSVSIIDWLIVVYSTSGVIIFKEEDYIQMIGRMIDIMSSKKSMTERYFIWIYTSRWAFKITNQ